jgi:tetratricopeptide (TPR) repeat protein
MRYLCVHCDHRWEEEGSEPPATAKRPARCPGCMRATGVEAVGGATRAATGKPGRTKHYLLAAAGFVVVALVVLLVAKRTDQAAATGLAPLEPDDLRTALLADKVEPAGLEDLFAVDAAMEAAAEKAAGDADGPVAQADAVHQLVRTRASALAFVPWSLGEPRGTPVMVARDTFSALQKDKGRAQLYPLELAVLQAALLRTLDVPAMVAELVEVPGERAPLDASGYLGYFVVAVYPDEPGQGTPRYYDPYGNRSLPADAKAQVLTDKQVVAGLLAVRALYQMAYQADPRAALETSSQALTLAASLPSVRSARGVILLGNSMIEQGLEELKAARQLRPDAPRLHNLASAMLLTGAVEGAERDLTAALAKAPDFAAAHATLGALQRIKGDADAARAELERAEQLAPDLSLVQWALAEKHLREGDREGALARAERALGSRPSFDAKLRHAVILRQAGKYDEMRKVAHELVAMGPDYRKGELAQLVKSALGPTALDELEGEEAGDEPAAGATAQLPDLNLQLDKPSLLGDPREGAARPGGGQGGAGDPLILLGDPSKLRLRGSGNDDLNLKLDR